jgi:calcium-translocating P-type ATPase
MGVEMTGLTAKEVLVNRKNNGSNVLTKVKRKSFFKLIIESASDPIIKILLIVLMIKIIFLFRDFDWFETIGILIAIILASVISAISEYGSESAFENLEEESCNGFSFVIRDSSVKKIESTEIVYKDIVILNSGDKIPADGHIIEGSILVNESSINGEAKEKEKGINDIVYSSTVIYDGNAKMLVDKVGDNTLIGSLAKEIQSEGPISPLKVRLNHLAKIISIFGYIGAILASTVYLISTNNYSFSNILYALTLGVTVIVVAVPEGLPMMITLVLSSNMKKMLKSNILVRKLVGIETAGNINVLLTDKTGTLTEGILNVIDYVSPSLNSNKSIMNLSNKLREEVNNNLYYNNSSFYDDKKNIVGGNATDQALLKFSFKSNYYQVIYRKTFDSNNKYSLVTLDNNITYIKGASEVLLNNCNYYLDDDGNKKLLMKRINIEKKIDEYASKGIRVLVLCSSSSYYDTNEINNLTFLGFVLIKDKVRDTTNDAIRTLNNAGTKVIMVTGDAINTGIAIGKETGIIRSNDDIAIDSKQLNNMSDEDIIRILPNLKIVARALPSDKSRLVNVLENNNLIVGMTGDGINDTPALKKANVGFAVGSGTEVAKSASDIIILDNNILSITKSVLFGRTIFKSIRKFIVFQLTVNLCAMVMAVIGPLLDISSPVTIIQMLWINMIMDTLAGVAFAHEPPLKEYMMEPPKKNNTKIINDYMYGEIFLTGMYSAILGILFLKLPIFNILIRDDNRYLMTAYFALFIFTGIFNALNARTERLNVLASITKNVPFILIFSAIMLIQIYLIYYGGDLFRTYGLTITELIYVLLLSLTVIPFDIFRKIRSKKRFKKTT